MRGRRPFPIDLLRVERCWPATGLDSRLIEVSNQSPDEAEVTLEMAEFTRPVFHRWARAGWTVSRIERWSGDETLNLLNDYADGGTDVRRDH